MIVTKAQNDKLRLVKTGLTFLRDRLYNLPKRIANTCIVENFLYDQAVSGSIPTATPIDTLVQIPAGALIKTIYFDVQTAIAASGGVGTLDVYVGADKVVSAATEASVTALGFVNLTLVGTKCKVATAGNLKLQANVAAFDSGKGRIFVEYVLAES